MVELEFVTEPDAGLLAGITALYRAQGWWGDGPDDPAGLARLIRGSLCFLVARAGVEVVGMARAIGDGLSDAYIQDVTVRADHRGRGLGPRLAAAVLDRLRADGYAWIGLIAERGTADFYASLGFEPMAGATPMLFKAGRT